MDIKAILAAFALLSSLQSGAQSLFRNFSGRLSRAGIRSLREAAATRNISSTRTGCPSICPAIPERAAVPAGQLGTEGMVPPAPFSDPEKYNDYYTYDYHVPENMAAVLEIPQGNPEKAVEHISGLGFRTREGILLKPLYDTHHRRYIVYWNVVGK